MFQRLLKPPSTSFFLFGMRGVGKTTWAREQFPRAHWVDLLIESEFQAHLVDARLFRQTVGHLKANDWVVVDEVQRLPTLLNEVHSLIESRRLRFVLLGSSARKLRRAGVNLLGGRALRRSLAPLLPAELGDTFDLNEVLRFGSLPLVLNAPSKEEQLEAYVQLYLKEEIQAEALVRNLAGFARFLPVAALFHGQVLNVDGLARDCGVSRSTVQGYLEILEDTLLVLRLPAFEGRLRVKERTHPKLYWLDSGVARAAKRQLAAPGLEERGVLLEGLVAQWLQAYRDLGRVDCDAMFYWAVAGGARTEVDFVLQRGKQLFAMEVKASQRLRDEHLLGLRAIAELRGVQRRVLVYLGDRSLTLEDGIEVWPVTRLLAELERGLSWSA